MNNEEQSHDVSFSPASGFRLFIPQDSIVPLERGDASELRIRSIGRVGADGLLCLWKIPKEKKKKKPSKKKTTPKKSPAKKPPSKKK